MFSQENVPLAPLTTLGVGGVAARLVRVDREAECVDAVRDADSRGEPLLILGGGSNVVIADSGWPGIVVRVATRGLKVTTNHDHVVVDVAAGEVWDEVAARAVDEEWSGVECLAAIPGLVGATPIQNVGAYGQEVAQTIASVRVFDREKKVVRELQNADCAFSYRQSCFKGDARFVVLSVRFEFRRSAVSRPIAYAELAKALGVSTGGVAPCREVRSAVTQLRRAKGMVIDPADPDSVSVGSFFVNPILTREALKSLEKRAIASNALHPSERLPHFDVDDAHVKIAAAWLIERSGIEKGAIFGRVGVSAKHALAIINRGGAAADDVIGLAAAIRARVYTTFGVTIEPEPVLVGLRMPPHERVAAPLVID